MTITANSSPVTRSLPKTDVPEQRTAPAADPLQEAQEVVEAIRADCRVVPDDYLDEVHVPGGGE